MSHFFTLYSYGVRNETTGTCHDLSSTLFYLLMVRHNWDWYNVFTIKPLINFVFSFVVFDSIVNGSRHSLNILCRTNSSRRLSTWILKSTKSSEKSFINNRPLPLPSPLVERHSVYHRVVYGWKVPSFERWREYLNIWWNLSYVISRIKNFYSGLFIFLYQWSISIDNRCLQKHTLNI